MDFIDWIGIGIWIWGAYKGWGTVSSWKWEWINRPEPLNYVVKGAFILHTNRTGCCSISAS